MRYGEYIKYQEKATGIMKFAKSLFKGERGTVPVIGIAGIGHGTGVTHTVLLLANYFEGVLGRKTAVLEWNNHGDFCRFGNMCTGQKKNQTCYRIQKVDYYPKADGARLVQCMGGGYQQVLIDFGAMEKAAYVEFMRCSSIWILMSFSEWQMEAFWDFADSKEFGIQKSWQFFTVFGSEESRIEWNKRRKPEILRIPLSVDAFTVTRPLIGWAEMALQRSSSSDRVSQ